jgi:hypothetical protein
VFELFLTNCAILANPSELLDRILNKYDKRVRPFTDEQVSGLLIKLMDNFYCLATSHHTNDHCVGNLDRTSGK